MENREIKTIKLSNAEVDVITYLTWGESEEIQTVLMSGANVDGGGLTGFDAGAVTRAKYKAMEKAVPINNAIPMEPPIGIPILREST